MSTADHTRLVAEIRMGLRGVEGLVLWLNSQVTVLPNGTPVARPGLCTGAADLIGIYRGRFVALEVKTGLARLSPEQRLFAALVTKFGGLAAVVRSLKDAEAALGVHGAR